MWYVAKGIEIIGLVQVLIGLFIGFSQDDLKIELKLALVGVVIFAVGRFLEIKFSKGR